MAERNPNPNPNPNSEALLSTLGEEIIRIVTPVSICMLIVVLLVTTLSSPTTISIRSIATMAYSESDTDTLWSKLSGAVLNSLVFVATITILTFLLLLLFYFRLTGFLKIYMAFSSFVVLAFFGGVIALLLIDNFQFPLDAITFLFLLFNLSVVGVLAVSMAKVPILVTQGYLVAIGVLVAYWFTMLPEWTTWALLIAMSVYDLAAVLLPGGPLRLLVELAISRDEDIPALVYEARPVEPRPVPGRRLWRERRVSATDPNSNSVTDTVSESSVATSEEVVQETRLAVTDETRVPLIDRQVESRSRGEEEDVEGIGLGSSGAIKLGLGDFIFYSVLVGRAALYDFMAVYACYLAIIAGLVLFQRDWLALLLEAKEECCTSFSKDSTMFTISKPQIAGGANVLVLAAANMGHHYVAVIEFKSWR